MLFETENFVLFSDMVRRAVIDGLFFEAGCKLNGYYFIKYSGQ